MEKIYNLENEADLAQFNKEVMDDVEIANNYKEITIVNPRKELIAIKVEEDEDVVFDASQYPNGAKLLGDWQQLVSDGKVKCKITEQSDLMIKMHFKAGSVIYVENEGMLTWLLENVSNYSLVYGLPLNFANVNTDELLDAVMSFEKDGKLDIKEISKNTPHSTEISMAGLINIPAKYTTAYTQAKSISMYLKSVPFMKVVPVDMIFKVIDRLFDNGVLEFSDAPRGEFMAWFKSKI